MNNSLKKSLESISPDILNGKDFDNRDYARKIINYPAMMVPCVQESIIKSLISELPEKVSMIDPFMGASNTLVTSMRYGINVFGQDINPLSVLVSQVKTHIYDDDLREGFKNISEKIRRSWSNKIDISFKNIDKWFKKDVQIELSQIRRVILKEENLFHRKFYWVILAEVIRLTNNDRTSTFKMHIRTQEDIEKRKLSPKDFFFRIAERSIEDIFNLKKELEKKDLITSDNNFKHDVDVLWGDSKERIRTEKSYNLLVTSPPYGDNHTTVTYGQFSYLPLQWIPKSDIDNDINLNYLDVIQEIDSQSLGGKNISEYSVIEENLFSKSKSLKQFFEGFTYEEEQKAKKVTNFVFDLDITIENILDKMQSNSFLAWTIGNRTVNNKEVKNDKILIELMEDKGVSLLTDLNRDILAKRMPEKNNFSELMRKEKILIFKKK
ncbi:MAG: hypothetical protein GYB37_15125 [Algicola sp.]|nr:hypothetical protein [Algicola sp.]